MKNHLLPLLMLLVLAAGCKKEAIPTKITAPANGAVYHSGDSIPFSFNYYNPSVSADSITVQIFLLHGNNDSAVTTTTFPLQNQTHFASHLTYNVTQPDSFILQLNVPTLGAQTDPPSVKFYVVP